MLLNSFFYHKLSFLNFYLRVFSILLLVWLFSSCQTINKLHPLEESPEQQESFPESKHENKSELEEDLGTKKPKQENLNEEKIIKGPSWVIKAEGAPLYIRKSAQDQEGNVYFVASISADYQKEIKIYDNSSTAVQLSLTEGEKIIIAKFNNDGKLLWCKTLEDEVDTEQIHFDKKFNILIAGHFSSQEIRLRDAISEEETHLFSQNGEEDIFIIKINKHGHLDPDMPKIFIGGSKTDYITKFKTDYKDYFYAIGGTHSPFLKMGIDFTIEGLDLGPIWFINFIVRLDPKTGKPLWGKMFPVLIRDIVNLEGEGLILLAEQYEEEIKLGEETFTKSCGGGDSLLIKLSQDGEIIWTKQIKNEATISVSTPTFSPQLKLNSLGNMLVHSRRLSLSEDCKKDPLSPDQYFIRSYSTEGNLLWENSWKGMPAESELLMDEGGNLFSYASTEAPDSFETALVHQGQTILSEPGKFLQKINTQGHLVFAKTLNIEKSMQVELEEHSKHLDEQGGLALRASVRECLNQETSFGHLSSNEKIDCEKSILEEWIHKYSAQGNPLWTFKVSDLPRSTTGLKILSNHSKEVIATFSSPERASVIQLGKQFITKSNEGSADTHYLFQVKEDGQPGWVHWFRSLGPSSLPLLNERLRVNAHDVFYSVNSSGSQGIIMNLHGKTQTFQAEKKNYGWTTTLLIKKGKSPKPLDEITP